MSELKNSILLDDGGGAEPHQHAAAHNLKRRQRGRQLEGEECGGGLEGEALLRRRRARHRPRRDHRLGQPRRGGHHAAAASVGRGHAGCGRAPPRE